MQDCPEEEVMMFLVRSGGGGPKKALLQMPIIESSKSIDMRICCGLSFLWNVESPRNLQQTKAE